MRRPFRLLLVLIVAVGLLAAACGDDDDDSTPAATTTTAPAVSGSANVFAAASLTGAFNEMGTAFTQANPAAKVAFNFGGSATLVTQITQGAPADVFASADTVNMDKLVAADANADAPVIFAANVLEIAVVPGNPKGIQTLQDLAKPNVTLVLCQVQQPCGNFANQALTKANVAATPKSLEPDVKSVLTKVQNDEADAGIVYATDVQAAGTTVQGVPIPTAQNAVANYPIVLTEAASSADVGQAFIDFVLSSDGQLILKKYGFGPPS